MEIGSITLNRVIEFLVMWLVSAIVIYIAVKIYPGKQKRENIGGALLTALLGKIVYTIFNIIFAVIHIPIIGGSLIGGLIAFIVWLWVLKQMFGVGWLGAAFIAFLIWVLNALVGFFLPTLL